MAGLNTGNIVDDLSCPLCHQMFMDPVTLQSCGHNFCRACLRGQQTPEIVEGQNIKTCPVCQKTCPADMYAPNIALQMLVEKVKEPENEAVRQMMMAPQDLNDQLNCGLCCKMFQDPVILQTCGHSFCHGCLQKRSTSADRGETTCPTCKEKCPGDRYVHNVVLANLVKRINSPGNQNEGQEEEEEGQGKEGGPVRNLMPECEMHKERISLFCLNDRTLCCLVCRDSIQHLCHMFVPLTEASTMVQVNLFLSIQKQLRILNDITKMSTTQEKKVTEHKAGKLQLSEHITNEYKKLHNFLKDAEQKQLQELDKMYDPILKKMEQNSTNLIKKQKELEKNLSECQKKLMDSHIGMLQNIKEFMRHPKRFSHFNVALAKEGFSHGRHYWEVNIDKKMEWAIGLAKESVDRKQTRDASLRDGYWAIFHSSHHGILVLTAPIVSLGIKVSPKRIGVYLDYQGGQVSFYDAENMAHLYSFSSTFTEKLYPYVGTTSTETVPMNIVHIRL